MQNQINLDTCSRELIHTPNAIQPHGYLLVLDESHLNIRHVSENLQILLDCPLESLVDQPLSKWLVEESLIALQAALKFPDLRQINPLPMRVLRSEQTCLHFDAIVHRSGPYLILEWEPVAHLDAEAPGLSFFSYLHRVRLISQAIQNTVHAGELFKAVVEQVKNITGFDRVLIYQFEPDWTGVTLAEVREAHMDSYLGLRFPASDIPEQARLLYTRNWLRLIANSQYVPARIVPEPQPPLDLSYSTLRSVSPVHLQYMRNMRTGASMSVSIIKDDRLWGLISCHHEASRYVDYQTRVACEFIGQILSQQMGALEGKEDYAQRQRLKGDQENLAAVINQLGLTAFLQKAGLPLAEFLKAQGAVIVTKHDILTFGVTPKASELRDLVDWLRIHQKERYFATHQLTKYYPKADLATCAGLLAIPIANDRESYLLWLRTEVIQTVSWAGRPEKSKEHRSESEDGPYIGISRLSPRKSFTSWQETKRSEAAPWLPAEIDAALDLKNNILAEELARTNHELAQSNEELDAFASIAAHDLKEPIRGIKNYANFIREDHGKNLDPLTLLRLETISCLGERVEGLLGSLYHYSRAGRVHLAMNKTDLNQVLADILLRLRTIMDEHNVHIILPRRLPTLVCDSVRSGEVFYNLILNAIKYNNEAEKMIEIGTDGGPVPVFFVKDNGIGIPEEHLSSVFTIFKRLHGTEEFGGGTGSGLAIAKRIVQRHSGRIWAESEGKGSTFRFTFGPTV